MAVEELVKRFEEVFLEEKATEVAKARDAIVAVLREQRVTLPAAVFALDLVKMELVRSKLEEFLGHVRLGEGLPLKVPEPLEALEQAEPEE